MMVCLSHRTEHVAGLTENLVHPNQNMIKCSFISIKKVSKLLILKAFTVQVDFKRVTVEKSTQEKLTKSERDPLIQLEVAFL